SAYHRFHSSPLSFPTRRSSDLMSHIAVIGAGISGITTAYALSLKGYQVTVIDRLRYPAMETSFANGGQLSACNAEVWNSRSTILKGLKWMMRKDAPLLFNPKPRWHKYSWIAQFVGAISGHERNTVATVKLAQRQLDGAMCGRDFRLRTQHRGHRQAGH